MATKKEIEKRAAIRNSIYHKFSGKCGYCGCDIEQDDFHVDHLLPRNGKSISSTRNELDNLMPACCSCNSSKSNLSIEDFRNRIHDRVNRLNEYSREYQIAKRFGLIIEAKIEVLFHFEKTVWNG